MHVADLRICRELYELSGWEYSRAWFDQSKPWVSDYFDHNPPFICPAYDLGYLVRKLPHHRGSRTGAMLDLHLSAVDPGFGWRAEYTPDNYAVLESGLTGEADTPEDAVAKLAIELFKQAILTT
jgi:hypothetical protein